MESKKRTHYNLSQLIIKCRTCKPKYGIESLPSLMYPTSYTEINSVKYYLLGKGFYTTDISDIVKAQKTRYKRMYSSALNRQEVLHIKYDDLSLETRAYLISKVESAISNSNCVYFAMVDLYFTKDSVHESKRRLCVVIKHMNSRSTKAVYINI